jgi:hypothetical protein|tara:strand:- start:20107 stop:21429 length:1323 start_codon:yes stop_codon:yes gene_type:complete
VNAGINREQGQAMVLGLLLCGVAVAALLHYFSLGQVLAERTRQVTALDTAAYSGAVVQSRALNLLALSNRAMVGHHLAMGHLVTLASWAQLGGHQAQQRLRANPPAFLIGMLFGASHGAAYAASSGANGLQREALQSGQLGRQFMLHESRVHDTLVAVQTQVVSTLAQMREAAIRTVLNRYYPSAQYELKITAPSLDQWLERRAGPSLHPFMLQVSRGYGFLQERNHTARNAWLVSPRCPARRHQLRRRGDTVLDESGRWEAADTHSYHALRSNRWIGCYYREYAMGWGWLVSRRQSGFAAPHVVDPPDNFASQDFWRWVAQATNWDILNGHDNPMANSRAVGARVVWPTRGYASYFDVRESSVDDQADERLLLTGGQPMPFHFSTELRRFGYGNLQYTVASGAESYFERPVPRGDGRHERANLFNPYWLARQGPAQGGL